ncbi:hypothetical protein [Aurantibacter sp.]|uniref:hypothetical protein n=1 Tax=Aurantibacter sp. TaxID=2807103 RepID=UPI003264F7C5
MQLRVILLLCLLLVGCASKEEEPDKNTVMPKVILETKKANYIAGDSISLTFKVDTISEKLKLQLKNAFGNIILAPESNNDNLINFVIPINYTRLAGPCRWQLLHDEALVKKGKFNIATNTPAGTHLESYFGPRSITAGNNDFSMLTIVPTDIYDNPLNDGTEVTVKHQFQENISDLNVTTESFFAWYNVRSTTKSGRILVTSECNGTTSKELATIVFPANATDFSISATSAHNYADGNQIITFESDIIRDEFGNIVSNGTLVTFVIKNENDAYLYTIGTTLNGIAIAKTLHPDKASKWEIQAFVTGAAESDITEFAFKAAINDYPVHFSKGNRNIDIGPFESFMKQLIPDGLLVQLDIYDVDGNFIQTEKTTTKNGTCNIFLGEHYLPDGNYILKIQAAGIKKEFRKDIHGN